MGGIPPACRNQRDPTTQETRASCTALSGYSPRAMAAQKRPRSSRRPTGGRPGDRRGFCTRFAASHLACLVIETSEVREVFRRPIESTQYVSMRYTERLAEAGAAPSVGSVGDAYENALAESVIGLYKTEVIRRRGPWRSFDDVEFATLKWVAWFNTQRLLEPLGYVPPAEYEAAYHETQTAHSGAVGLN